MKPTLPTRDLRELLGDLRRQSLGDLVRAAVLGVRSATEADAFLRWATTHLRELGLTQPRDEALRRLRGQVQVLARLSSKVQRHWPPELVEAAFS